MERGHKRNNIENDQVQLRPKRNRQELALQRKRLLETSSEEFRKVQPAWKKTLPDTTTSDSDSLQCIQVKIKTGCTEPHRSTPESVAYDITAEETVVIKLGTITMVALNLRLALSPDTVLLWKSRSGLTIKGITVEAGVIDSDYRGQIKDEIQIPPVTFSTQ